MSPRLSQKIPGSEVSEPKNTDRLLSSWVGTASPCVTGRIRDCSCLSLGNRVRKPFFSLTVVFRRMGITGRFPLALLENLWGGNVPTAAGCYLAHPGREAQWSRDERGAGSSPRSPQPAKSPGAGRAAERVTWPCHSPLKLPET